MKLPLPSPAWIAATALLAVVLFSPAVLNDGDTFSHVAAGDWMIQHRTILDHDPFSYTRQGAPWLAHEWLAEIFMAVTYRMAGWSGVVTLTALAAALAFYNLGRHLSRWLPDGAALILLVLAAACVTPGLLARPHILALPVFEAFAAGLFIARAEGRAPSWWLVALMGLWANLHGGFLIGLVLAATLAIEAVLADLLNWRSVLRRWTGFLAAATAAALVTPHGLSGLLLGVRMSGLAELSYVSEWQPTNFAVLQPLELLIMIGLYMGLGRGARLPPVRLLIVLGLLHLALQHTRHLALIGLIVPLLVAEPLGAALPQATRTCPRLWLPAANGALLALLVAGRLARPIILTDSPTAPISALAHVPAALRGQPVFNDYAFGGYLIFEHIRPFIDARAELYGQAGLRQYAEILQPGSRALNTVLSQNSVTWTILSPGNPAAVVVDSLPHWCRLYADNVAIVQVKNCPGS